MKRKSRKKWDEVRMIIPNTLKIGGHIFDVIVENPDKLSADECGHNSRHNNEIVLDGSLPRSQLEETLFHEIFHGLNSTIDHTLLDSLAEQLYQVFSDNNLLK